MPAFSICKTVPPWAAERRPADHQTPANSLYLDSPAGINVANNMTLSGTAAGNSDSGDTTTGPGLIQNVQGNNSLSGAISLYSGAGPTVIKCNSGSLTVSGTIGATTSGRTLYLGGVAPGFITGLINDNGNVMNVTKVDSGLWTLSGTQNIWTGLLTVGNGTLAIATLGDSGPGSNGAGPITIGSSVANETATLQFIGSSGTTTARAINLGGNAAIDASGTSPLYLGYTISGTNNLTLTGSGAGEAAGAIDLAAGGLVKNGSGQWTLNQASVTSTGPAAINAGTLVVANGVSGSALGSGTLTLNGGTLAAGPAGGTIAGLVQAGSGPHTIAPGAGLSAGYGTLNLNGGLNTNANTTLAFNLNLAPSIGTRQQWPQHLWRRPDQPGRLGLERLGRQHHLRRRQPDDAGRLSAVCTPGRSVPRIATAFSLPPAPPGETYQLSTSVDFPNLDLVVQSTWPAGLGARLQSEAGATRATGRAASCPRPAARPPSATPSAVRRA